MDTYDPLPGWSCPTICTGWWNWKRSHWPISLDASNHRLRWRSIDLRVVVVRCGKPVTTITPCVPTSRCIGMRCTSSAIRSVQVCQGRSETTRTHGPFGQMTGSAGHWAAADACCRAGQRPALPSALREFLRSRPAAGTTLCAGGNFCGAGQRPALPSALGEFLRSRPAAGTTGHGFACGSIPLTLTPATSPTPPCARRRRWRPGAVPTTAGRRPPRR